MAGETPLDLLDANGATLLSLIVRAYTETSNNGLRNLDPVQPAFANRQGAFGSGIHQAGVWERDVALCDPSSYATQQHAMAALDRALVQVAALEYEDWRLPIAAGVGIVNRVAFPGAGFRAKIRLVPASPWWRYTVNPGTGTANQIGTGIFGGTFTAADVGRLIEFANGREAIITAYVNATTVETDTVQDVTSQAYALMDAATGLI